MKIAIREMEPTKRGLQRSAVSITNENNEGFYHVCVTNGPDAKLIAAGLELLIQTEDGRALVAATAEAYWKQRKIW